MIRKLDTVVSSRIAAGEVVEKPASVLRELLDNAIDSSASRISVYMEEGGIKSIRVTDNGCGISKEDLPLAFERHCTSKIETLDDLFALRTLGFRGEALSSIASCSVLTIESSGKALTCRDGIMGQLRPSSVTEGTSVIMEDLFEAIPARKQFLRRPSSEGADCKKVFLEKALGFESIDFSFFEDGRLFLHLPSQSRAERVSDVFSLDRSFIKGSLIELKREADQIVLEAVFSSPDCYKRDRSQIKILVNNRIVDNYQLVQAVTSACSAALPGGAFPFFCLFIQDSPSLVDFNIHPSKRECKMRNQSTVYGLLTNLIREYLFRRTANEYKESSYDGSFFNDNEAKYQAAAPERTTPAAPKAPQQPFNPDPRWFEAAKTVLGKKNAEKSTEKSTENNTENSRKYIGQVFNTFLVVETGEELLFIDQHAAHERLLYDEIRSLKDVQQLIIPYAFDTDRSTDDYLIENSWVYREFGVELVRTAPMKWEMASIPAVCRKNEDEVVRYITTCTGDVESARKGLFAVMACHAAVKAGDVLDRITAEALVDKVFRLDRMVCPHGRSFTFRITKEELYKAVGRII